MGKVETINGNNFYNNRIKVDFVNKKVDFEPVIQGRLLHYYFSFLTTIGFSLAPIFFIAIISMLFVSFVLGLIETEKVIVVQILISIYILAIISISLLFFNKQWRANKFPEFNLKLARMFDFFNRKSVIDKKIVNKNSIVNNRFVIPYFGNIMLKYKVVGDFSEYLTIIKIENLYDNNDTEWMAVFEFSQTPVHGFMEIEYL